MDKFIIDNAEGLLIIAVLFLFFMEPITKVISGILWHIGNFLYWLYKWLERNVPRLTLKLAIRALKYFRK